MADVALFGGDEALSDEERDLFEQGKGGGDAPLPERSTESEPKGPPAEGQEAPEGEPERAERDQHVPLAKMLEERKNRQEVERRAQAAEQRATEAIERANKVARDHENLLARIRQAAQDHAERERQAVPAPPDPETQPFEALKYERQQREDLARRLEERDRTAAEERQLAEVRTRFEAELASHEEKFAEKNPDYNERVKAVAVAYASRIKAQHPNAPDHEVWAAAVNEMKAEAWDLRQRGRDPALYFHTIAPQVGYKPKAAPATAASKPAVTTPRDEGGRWSSLSDVQGTAPREGLTADRVASMPEDEISALIRKGVDIAHLIRPRG
jgi:hypothetical protein